MLFAAAFFSLPLSLSLSSAQFCLAGSRQNLSVMLYLPCLCVCVFIICGFSLFSHSFFFAGALKFKQSAINYTCWALSHFPAFQLTVFPSLSLGPLKNICILQGASEFQYVLRLIIAAAASASIASLQQSRRQSLTSSLSHSVSVPVQLAWQCVSRSEIQTQLRLLPGRCPTRLCQ